MKTKRLLSLILTLALGIGLLPAAAWALSADSSETIYLYVGQRLEYQRPEPFALDYAGLTAYFKSDAYSARAYSAEVFYGEKPDWFHIGVQPSRPGRFLYYGYTELGAGTEHNLNPCYTVKASDKGECTFYIRVTMALSGSKYRTVTHKVTLVVEDEPRVASERTVYLLPDKEPLDGRAVVKPGGLVRPTDLAFPLPDAAWKYTEPEDHAAGQAAYFSYDWTGTLPTRLAIGSRHVTGLPYYMPDWEENSGPYLYRYDDAWPTEEGEEYTVLFRIRPRGEGDYFTPFNYRVRFQVTPAGAPYDIWIDGVQLDRLNALDPTGDGAFCYDPDTQTLGILDSHESDYTDGAMIVSYVPELRIVVDGENVERTLQSPGSCLELHGHTTMEGAGSLRLVSEHGVGIEVRDGKRLTVDLEKMNVSGETGGILGGNGTLYIEKSLTAVSAGGAVTGFDYIWWDEVNAELTVPWNGYVDSGAIVDAEGHISSRVSVTWSQPYDIWIDGERITARNWLSHKNDILFYNAVSHILYIRGGSYTGTGYAPLVRSSIEGLRISVHGDTTLRMPDGAMYPIFELRGDTTINAMQGKTLTLECEEWVMGACIEVWDSTLTLLELDGLTLRHAGKNALQGGGSASLVVEGSVVTAECLSIDEYSGAIASFRSGIELHGSAVQEPVPWGLDADGSLTDGAGNLAKRVVFRRTPKLTILSCSTDKLRYQIDRLPADGETLLLVAAAYDAAGRLLETGSKPLTGDGGSVTDSIAVHGGAAAYRLFLLDSENRPVADFAEWRNA